MASNYLDEFISNFDLNHLTTEESAQKLDQKYDRVRRSANWLKSKIISTDFAIQKFLAKKDECEQLAKTLSTTKEELKQALINYKETLEKCAILENENKVSLGNQEVLKKQADNIENKYEALVSHTNQLQMLVKQLENERDALIVERELTKCNNKDNSQEVLALQKEKDVMLKDFVALKDVILGKKKVSKRHEKVIKKYVKDRRFKEHKILCTSEESDDETDNYGHISSQTQTQLNEIHKVIDKIPISNVEQNFIDNYSDGEISVDTGRGSSRANSHDKYLSSPDYGTTSDNPVKIQPKDDIKQVDACCSPIFIHSCRSVATSPILLDAPVSLFEDQFTDYTECFDGTEYIINDIPLSEDIDDLVEQEKLADCASPIRDPSPETASVKKNKFIICHDYDVGSFEQSPFNESDESNEFDPDLIIEKQTLKQSCDKFDTLTINHNIQYKDSCTSPLPIASHIRQVDVGTSTNVNVVDIGTSAVVDVVDIGTNTIEDLVSITLDTQTLKNCDKSTCTDTVVLSENKQYGNACISPIAELQKCLKCHEIDNNIEKKSANNVTVTEKQFVSSSTSTTFISLEQNNLSDTSTCVLSKENEQFRKPVPVNHEDSPVIADRISKPLNKKESSKLTDNLKKNRTEEIKSREEVCLENNSSKNIHYESANDSEVQNILNIMKLRHSLISPISQTPSDSEYLKLIPEMSSTLSKIWNTLKNIYKMPNQLRNSTSNPLNATGIADLEEIAEVETNNSVQQQLETAMENNITVVTSEILDIPINGNPNVTLSNESNIDIFVNSNTDETNLTSEEITRNVHQQPDVNPVDLNKSADDSINNVTDISKIIMVEDNNEDKSDSCKQNLEINEEKSQDNSNCGDDAESFNDTEGPVTHTIIISGTKSKKKSKLQKFRDKLVPTCKIKKIIPPIVKHSSKTYIKPKENKDSLSMNQQKAYENAVKVMAELRSNQELQDKNKTIQTVSQDATLGNKSSKITSLSIKKVEPNMLSTRSRTRRLSKKEDAIVVKSDQIIGDSEKSPVNRKLRKRPADTDVDVFKSKRMLRSSNVLPVTDDKLLPSVRNENFKEPLHNNIEKRNGCKTDIDTVLFSANPSASKSNDHNQGDILNLKSSTLNSQNEAVKPGLTYENRKKPVIELSKCLSNNANVVSIVPGNVGYLDFNKNINHTNESTGMTKHLLDDVDLHNHSNTHEINLARNESVITEKIGESANIGCITEHIQVTNKYQEERSKVYKETKDSTYTNEVPKDYNIGDKNVNNNEQIIKRNSPRKSNEQTLNVHHNDIINSKQNINNSLEQRLREKANMSAKNPVVQLVPLKKDVIGRKNNIVSYGDIDLFTEETTIKDKMANTTPTDCSEQRRKENILCNALDRYGVISVKYAAKKVPDGITLKICQKIEESITNIIASPKSEQKTKMNDLVNAIQNYKTKHIMAGLMKYLKDPTRKNELFNKVINGPAPPMTKSEVILLYVIESLNGSLGSRFINRVWNNIEHALFQLNRTPEFNVIESMSHFYAVLCRYFRNKSRLRCFMLDAMYCLQFKAVPLIRQCLDVCPGVLPNAHEHMAKTSLVTCLVYLLHFYKCQDKFNRAQDIRNILSRRYQYRFSEWNETMILEIFRKAIMDLRGTQNDKKMLRVALIILCKRHGAKWCQLNIIQNMLLPILEKKDVPVRIKQFCVLMLGPLLKPFPADRKAQCEIVVNQLLQMLKQNPSHEMQEAVYSSLIFMSKHDQDRVVQALLSWNPEHVSSQFEEILNDYVMEKPLAMWKKIVSRRPSPCT